jgi:glycosyltransferase involved in cell wall biosynthesis
MAKKNKSVLIVASHYAPNVGGVETHLDDLTKALIRRRWKVVVATYVPLAKNIKVPLYEKKGLLTIFRMPWIGFNIVHKLTPYPLLEFLYLFPGLVIISFLALLNNPEIKVLHAQGLVPAVAALFVGKLMGKKVIMSTHNLYFFPKEGAYKDFSSYIISKMDVILGLSKQSEDEIKSIGVPNKKVKPFRYWLNLDKFKPLNKSLLRKKLKVHGKLVVYYGGRMIKTKGVGLILKAAKDKALKDVVFMLAGPGPMVEDVEELSRVNKNVIYLGSLKPEEVINYINVSDMILAMSTVDEGYGRAVMESIACGRPVLATKVGGFSEFVNSKIGKLIEPDAKQLIKWLKYFLKNPHEVKKRAKNCRAFALEHFSEKNVEEIIAFYR